MTAFNSIYWIYIISVYLVSATLNNINCSHNICDNKTFYLSSNSSTNIYCTGSYSCNSINIISNNTIESLNIYVSDDYKSFTKSNININLNYNGNIYIECDGHKSCTDSIFNIYSNTINNKGLFQMNCSMNDSCYNLMINTERINKMIMESCNSCTIYSPILGITDIIQCLTNNSNLYSVEGIKNINYKCNTQETFNLFCGLLYDNLCKLYVQNEQYECMNNKNENNLCIMDDADLYNESLHSLQFPLFNDIINCEIDKNCYIYGQSSIISMNDSNTGITIFCAKNKNCSLIHCGNDCENMKLFANDTNTLNINCKFLNNGNCKNSIIKTNECKVINIYDSDSSDLITDFSQTVIINMNHDNISNYYLYIDGYYKFDNLSINSMDTIIDIECMTSCKYTSIYNNNGDNVDILCNNNNDYNLCDGVTVYYDNKGCKMELNEITNNSWKCIEFDNNDNNPNNKNNTKWKWIAIDSSVGIVSLGILIVFVCCIIIYCQRRKKQRLDSNYIMLQETAKYYQH